MAVSKVIYKSSPQATGVTWMDATTATAAAADILAPKTAMLADGVMTTGTGTGGGSGVSYKKGTYTPSTTHNTAENVEITTLATIGFTPKKMCFYVTNRSNLSGKSSVLLYTICDIEHTTRFTMRYSNSSGTTAATGATTNWTMQAGGYLYCDGTKVYIRTSSSYGLISNVEYTWEAFG